MLTIELSLIYTEVQPVNKETDEHVDFYAINGALRANRRGHYEFGSFSDPFIRSDSASALPECDIATTSKDCLADTHIHM